MMVGAANCRETDFFNCPSEILHDTHTGTSNDTRYSIMSWIWSLHFIISFSANIFDFRSLQSIIFLG
ncbi:MAG TPA: hypothetical protein DDY13_16390 [Cytophagales bacterium]|nr:hypothetical protein [Cytophagales bacterium]